MQERQIVVARGFTECRGLGVRLGRRRVVLGHLLALGLQNPELQIGRAAALPRRLTIPVARGGNITRRPETAQLQRAQMIVRVDVALCRCTMEPVGRVQRPEPLIGRDEVLIRGLAEPARRLGRVAWHALAAQIHLTQPVLRLTIAEIRRLSAQHRRRIQVRRRARPEQMHQRHPRLQMTARRGAPQPRFGGRWILRDAPTAPVQLTQVEHRGRLTGIGGLIEQRRGAPDIVRHVVIEQEQECEAQLRGGIPARRALLEPLERTLVIAGLTVAPRIQHAEPELTGGMLLRGGLLEPTLRLLEVLVEAESDRILMAQARLGAAVARLRSERVPMRRAHRRLGDGQAFRKHALQERIEGRALLELLQRRRRRRVRRLQPRQIDFTQTRHGGHQTLIGCLVVPADRRHHVAQHALATLVRLPETILRLRRTGIGKRTKDHRSIGVPPERVRLLRLLERGRTLAQLEKLREKGSETHGDSPSLSGMAKVYP